MIGYDQVLAICRSDPESAARMLCELSRELDALRKEIAALQAENATLRERVQTLEERIAKDSHNSHKPPSSDGLAKPKPKSLRPPSNRPSGGQPGHTGHTLHMVENPDRTVRHTVERCTGCGVCVDECPVLAITLVRHVARVDAARCTGCGQCVEACPSGAISLA